MSFRNDFWVSKHYIVLFKNRRARPGLGFIPRVMKKAAAMPAPSGDTHMAAAPAAADNGADGGPKGNDYFKQLVAKKQ